MAVSNAATRLAPSELFDSLGSDKYPTNVFDAASRYYATNKPGALAGWISSNLEHVAAKSASGLLASNWCKSDSLKASEWVNTLPGGNIKQAATAGLARELMKESPAEAMPWIEQISDPKLKEKLRNDAKAAMQSKGLDK